MPSGNHTLALRGVAVGPEVAAVGHHGDVARAGDVDARAFDEIDAAVVVRALPEAEREGRELALEAPEVLGPLLGEIDGLGVAGAGVPGAPAGEVVEAAGSAVPGLELGVPLGRRRVRKDGADGPGGLAPRSLEEARSEWIRQHGRRIRDRNRTCDT